MSNGLPHRGGVDRKLIDWPISFLFLIAGLLCYPLSAFAVPNATPALSEPKPPMATSNSSTCGQVKIPHLTRSRWRELSVQNGDDKISWSVTRIPRR
jgi:hypothetical protein